MVYAKILVFESIFMISLQYVFYTILLNLPTYRICPSEFVVFAYLFIHFVNAKFSQIAFFLYSFNSLVLLVGCMQWQFKELMTWPWLLVLS